MSEPGELDAVQEQHLAVTRDAAARIAGLSHRQVDYWAATGLIEPTVDTRVALPDEYGYPASSTYYRCWSRRS
jgi:hypothetical protein